MTLDGRITDAMSVVGTSSGSRSSAAERRVTRAPTSYAVFSSSPGRSGRQRRSGSIVDGGDPRIGRPSGAPRRAGFSEPASSTASAVRRTGWTASAHDAAATVAHLHPGRRDAVRRPSDRRDRRGCSPRRGRPVESFDCPAGDVADVADDDESTWIRARAGVGPRVDHRPAGDRGRGRTPRSTRRCGGRAATGGALGRTRAAGRRPHPVLRRPTSASSRTRRPARLAVLGGLVDSAATVDPPGRRLVSSFMRTIAAHGRTRCRVPRSRLGESSGTSPLASTRETPRVGRHRRRPRGARLRRRLLGVDRARAPASSASSSSSSATPTARRPTTAGSSGSPTTGPTTSGWPSAPTRPGRRSRPRPAASGS